MEATIASSMNLSTFFPGPRTATSWKTVSDSAPSRSPAAYRTGTAFPLLTSSKGWKRPAPRPGLNSVAPKRTSWHRTMGLPFFHRSRSGSIALGSGAGGNLEDKRLGLAFRRLHHPLGLGRKQIDRPAVAERPIPPGEPEGEPPVRQLHPHRLHDSLDRLVRLPLFVELECGVV